MKIYENFIIDLPLDKNGDGLKLFGINNPNIVKNCIIDFKSIEISKLDENLSTIDGCEATIENSCFFNGRKGALCGNGDHPDTDRFGKVVFNNCIFFNNGKRNPEVQDGVHVILNECLIVNWGSDSRSITKNDRTFGAWSHKNGFLEANNCVFIQDSFFKLGFKKFFQDIFNSIGQAFNERDLSLLMFLPGSCKGAFSSNNGSIRLNNCYKNHWWIRLENLNGKLSETDAIHIISKTCSLCNKYNLVEYFVDNM